MFYTIYQQSININFKWSRVFPLKVYLFDVKKDTSQKTRYMHLFLGVYTQTNADKLNVCIHSSGIERKPRQWDGAGSSLGLGPEADCESPHF